MITLFLLAAVLCGTAACGSNMDNNTTDTKKEESVNENTNTDDSLKAVSYTHLTLPTILRV